MGSEMCIRDRYSTGRFGVDEDYLRSADAIEIKIGQGAKPGQGGFLPKEKLTAEIAEVRKVDTGQDLHSPACHSDINNVDDLKKKIDWLREVAEGKPIILKLGAGDIEKDVELAVQAGPDVIAIDGMEGGSGVAPEVMFDEVGIPTIAAVAKARRTLDKLGAKQELLIGGGLNTAGDIAKTLALGADACFMSFAIMIALGCSYCQRCNEGKCPFGIATQDPELEKNLNVEEGAQKVANFIQTLTEELKMITGAVGKDDVRLLDGNDLRSLNPFISKVAGVELV